MRTGELWFVVALLVVLNAGYMRDDVAAWAQGGASCDAATCADPVGAALAAERSAPAIALEELQAQRARHVDELGGYVARLAELEQQRRALRVAIAETTADKHRLEGALRALDMAIAKAAR